MGILNAKDISYSYKSKYVTVNAVKGFSYEFDNGKIYAIVGKSGSGKTTLLSLLAGLDRPSSGTIEYAGQDLSKMNLDQYRRNNVSVVYQNFNLFSLLNVLENVSYPAELQGRSKTEALSLAKEYLEAVGLGETYWKRVPSMLSGGEQQRVAIARTLASGSSLILADEPTGNLDEENSRMIINMLLKLAHEYGKCVVVVTHDLEIADVADVILKMRDGELVENDL